MAPSRRFLGIDVGTQSTKALVIDADTGEVVSRGAVAYGLIEGLPKGHMEQHPETWIDAIRGAARQALHGMDPAAVLGVGVSGQQHGAVVLDEQSRVVRPAKLWCDTSTAAEAAQLSRALGREIPAGFTASKLAWTRDHEPRLWAKARHVLLPHDYVNFRLTDARTMECGDASGTGFFDSAARAFDARACAAIDARLLSMLPSLVAAGEPAGTLSAAGATLLGLCEGTLVSAGGGDNMMAAIGSGAAHSGVAVISLGTSGTVFARCDAPVVDPDGLIAPFCSSDGAWLPLLCVMNLTGVTETVRALTGMSHAALTAAAQAVPSGSDGLMWLPFLQGERVPNLPDATGQLVGMRGDNLTAGHLYRAALEGTSCNLALGAARLQRLGVPLVDVRLCGGAANNSLWQRILANLIGAPVRVVAETEAAALGAAIQAHWTHARVHGARENCGEAADSFVRTVGPAVEPSPDRSADENLLGRFSEELFLRYGVRFAAASSSA